MNTVEAAIAEDHDHTRADPGPVLAEVPRRQRRPWARRRAGRPLAAMPAEDDWHRGRGGPRGS